MSPEVFGKQADESYSINLDVGEAKNAVEQIWLNYIESNDLGYTADLGQEFHTELNAYDDNEEHEFGLQGRKFYIEFTQRENDTVVELYEDTGFTRRNILEPEETERDEFIQHLTSNWL